MTLSVGPTMDLPDEWVSHRSALLAMSGAGKSNGVVVMAEEMYDAGLPFVIVDPKGDVFGIRSSADGKAPGLPIPIFGGLHGDVPLEPTAGAYIADLIYDHNLTCLLDVSLFSTGEMRRFLYDFGDRLYRRHQQERTPRHIFLEEAEEPLPQSFSTKTEGGYAARCVAIWSKIAKLGRAFGLGVTMATQRSAGLNKNALTQVESLIILRTAGPQDLKAIKDWLAAHGAALTKEILDSLPSLPNGEAWVVSPHVLGKVERFTFRRRRTFDSGATPKIGEKPVKMTTLAEVDFAAIKEAMDETIERAKDNDPAELRKEIARLRRELERQAAPQVTEKIVYPLTSEERGTLAARLNGIRSMLFEAEKTVGGVLHAVQQLPAGAKEGGAADRRTPVRPETPAPETSAPSARRVAGTPTESRPAREGTHPTPVPDGTVSGSQRKVLDALAWLDTVGFPQPSKVQLGFIAGYRAGKSVGGRYGNLLGELRTAGLIDYPRAGHVALTEAGRAVASMPDIPPTTEGLQAAVFARLDPSEVRVLQGIIADYPDALSKQEAGERAGYTVGSSVGGRFGNILGKLRTLGLIDYPSPGTVKAEPVLFLEQR